MSNRPYPLSKPIAALVKQKMKVKQADIVRATGIDAKNVSKILQGTHNPTLETFLMICTAAGLKISLTDKKEKL